VVHNNKTEFLHNQVGVIIMKNVDAKTLNQWLSNKEAILIDVREPAEHAARKIPEANLYPLGELDKKKSKLPQDKKIVMHCKSGKRGVLACKKLLEMYPELDIYNLEGGIEAWEVAGFKTKTTESKILPLDQQVQLTIGIFLVFGSVLAYYLNPLFNLLTGFFGAGLIFAGLSGSCGMAKLIAKMPWNQKSS
jgi:rhodanese-related sulfurtransferase